MKDFVFEKVGVCSRCTGYGFEYERFSELSYFRQTGKIPSLRVVKTIIKLLDKG